MAVVNQRKPRSTEIIPILQPIDWSMGKNNQHVTIASLFPIPAYFFEFFAMGAPFILTMLPMQAVAQGSEGLFCMFGGVFLVAKS